MLTTNELTHDPVPILQRLIRFDTTNPPGNELHCVAYVRQLLDQAGVEAQVVAAESARPNLVARLPGRGAAPPLLLHAHTDVVPTDGQSWSCPPFAGQVSDGHIWGRGAIDMKGGLAMMLAAIMRLRAEGTEPAGDILLAVVADEEAGSKAGAGFLVERHPELFAGARYAIGEDGGAALGLGVDLRFHPIVVAEKRACWLRATLSGPAGHASRAAGPDTAMAKLARMLAAVQDGCLGRHLTPGVDRMLKQLACVLPEPLAGAMERVRVDGDDKALETLPERDRRYLLSVLHHTVNATVIRTAEKINVVPGEITVDLDGRLLPGEFEAADFIAELRDRVPDEVELEVLLEGEPMPAPRVDPLYDLLAGLLRDLDPAGVPLPMVTTASTDARLFGRLGMTCYGWLPLRLPPGTRYRDTLHGPDERVPADALRWGAQCFYRLLHRYR